MPTERLVRRVETVRAHQHSGAANVSAGVSTLATMTRPRADLSLDEALRINKIPLENHSLIRRLTAAVGVESYSQSASARHFNAHRAGGGPDLHIEHGFTNGFVSEDEITAIDPTLERELSKMRKGGLWVVWHPVNKRRDSSGDRTTSPVKKDYGTCRDCHQAYSATGACWC